MPERGPVGFGRREIPPSAPSGPGQTAPFPPGAVKLDDDIAAGLIPERPARGHKGSFGRLLVIAGSLDYAGAALLVCRAAGRSGVGLVTLAVPESLQPLFAAKVVEATTMALPEDDVEEVDPEPALARILDHEHDAIVVGPGLRPGLATTELVRSLLPVSGEAGRRADRPGRRGPALDGDDGRLVGRRAPAGRPDAARRRVRAASSRERRPSGRRRRPRGRRRGAPGGRPRCRRDVALGRRPEGRADDHRRPRRRRRDRPFENPALATGGTGDVLAGTIGSLLAQGLAPFAAARLGVYLHGLAGDAGRERFGDAGLLASDLPDGLAIARKRLAAVAERRSASKRLGFEHRLTSNPGDRGGAAGPDAGPPRPRSLTRAPRR